MLQIEAAEREEIFKGHLVYLEQRRERELERERERERELERDRELDAEEGGEKKVGSCALVVVRNLRSCWTIHGGWSTSLVSVDQARGAGFGNFLH